MEKTTPRNPDSVGKFERKASAALELRRVDIVEPWVVVPGNGVLVLLMPTSKENQTSNRFADKIIQVSFFQGLALSYIPDVVWLVDVQLAVEFGDSNDDE